MMNRACNLPIKPFLPYQLVGNPHKQKRDSDLNRNPSLLYTLLSLSEAIDL
jgi:hypothetical protein